MFKLPRIRRWARTSDAPEGAGPETPGEPRLWADKFSSPEQLEDAYLHAQRALGRYKNEVGLLRNESEQLANLLTAHLESSPPALETGEGEAKPPAATLAGKGNTGEQPMSEAELRAWQQRELEHMARQRSVELLRQEFGDEAVLEHKDALATVMAEPIRNPEARHQRLREVLIAAAYDRSRVPATGPAEPAGTPTPSAPVQLAPGSLAERIKAEIEASSPRDVFGAIPVYNGDPHHA